YRNVRCRERIKLKPTPKNIKYCAKLKARIEHEIATGEFDYKKHFPDSPRATLFSKMPGDALSIEDYLNSWLVTEKDNIKHSTWLGYSKILKYHLVPTFGKLPLSEFRRKHIYDWPSLRKALSAKRLRNILSVMRIALDGAVEHESIEGNSLAGFKPRKRSIVRSEDVDPFGAEERAAILSQLQGQDRNLIQF